MVEPESPDHTRNPSHTNRLISDDANSTDAAPTVDVPGPTNWWRLGLIALGAVALVLLILQLIGGGVNTDAVLGTPVTPPAALAQPAAGDSGPMT